MTQSTSSGESSVSDVATGVDQAVADAKRLGISWTLRPGTMISDFVAVYDGDAVEQGVRVIKLVPDVANGDRVMLMFVPPAGNFVIGYAPGSDPVNRLVRATSATGTTSNATYSTPTGMTAIRLRANTTYFISCNVLYTTAATTTGAQFQLAFTGTVKRDQLIGVIQGSTAATFTRVTPSLNDTVSWRSFDTLAATAISQITGFVTVDASEGDLTFQFRSEVNGSTITILADTHLAVQKMKLIE